MLWPCEESIIVEIINLKNMNKRNILDNKVYGANMGPTWVLSAPGGPHVGPMNLVISDGITLALLLSKSCERQSEWW